MTVMEAVRILEDTMVHRDWVIPREPVLVLLKHVKKQARAKK